VFGGGRSTVWAKSKAASAIGLPIRPINHPFQVCASDGITLLVHLGLSVPAVSPVLPSRAAALWSGRLVNPASAFTGTLSM
jgi:hypothetical protein